jgi:hypothetical protein
MQRTWFVAKHAQDLARVFNHYGVIGKQSNGVENCGGTVRA